MYTKNKVIAPHPLILSNPLAELSNRAKSYKDKNQIKPNKIFSEYYIKPPTTRYLL